MRSLSFYISASHRRPLCPDFGSRKYGQNVIGWFEDLLISAAGEFNAAGDLSQ